MLVYIDGPYPYHMGISSIEIRDNFKLKTGDGFKISFVLNGIGIGVKNVMIVVDMRKNLSK
jgi:hypothetical protein